MLLGARVANLRWYRRSLVGNSQSPFTTLEFSSLSQTKVSYTFEKKSEDFLPWLERKAGIGVSSSLSIGKSAHGRALFASKFIRAGDCILRVPYNVQLAPDNLLPEIKNLLNDDIGNVAKLATVVLFEQKMGWESDWAPYVCRLPHPMEMHSTIFWSEDELELICQSSAYQETINQKSLIEKEFSAIREAVQCSPKIFERITFKDFMYAYALVCSRAWGSARGVSLIPFADFLNHDGTSKAIVLSDDKKQLSEVIADRDYSAGEQVMIRYGKFSNATLLLDFGFTVPNNIHDQVRIQLNIPNQDPLCKMKLEILQTHHSAILRNIHGSNSSVDSFTINKCPDDREVRSLGGKGKGLPQPLRAFARVLCCTSPQELCDLAMEAEQNDGRLARRPLKNRSREIEAHQFLIAQITQLVENYEASIKSLAADSSRSVCERHALRRQMARYLLTGELRVLKSASAWLENYCTTLSTADNIY